MWTVNRLTRVWLVASQAWTYLIPGDTLVRLDWQGGNRVAVWLRREVVVIPTGSWDAIVPLPPERRSA